MKKVITSLLVSLMMILNVVTVYADKNIVVNKRKLDNGNVEVILSIDESVQSYGGNLTYSYDNTTMKLTNTMIIDDHDYLLVINENYGGTGNKIRIVFAGSKVLQGDLVALEFEPVDDKDINVDSIVIDEFALTDNTGSQLTSVSKDTVQINESSGKTLINDTVMKKYDETSIDNQQNNPDNNDSNENNEEEKKEVSKKEEKKETKEQESSNTGIIVGVVGGIVIISAIIIIVIKKKRKNR